MKLQEGHVLWGPFCCVSQALLDIQRGKVAQGLRREVSEHEADRQAEAVVAALEESGYLAVHQG